MALLSMNRTPVGLLLLVISGLAAPPLFGQSKSACETITTHVVNRVVAANKETAAADEADKPQKESEARSEIAILLEDGTNLTACLAPRFFPDKFQHEISALLESQRLDKQVGSSSSSAGTTSMVSAGSVPALLGLAVEHGAMTRSANGTTVTLRTTPAKLIAASKGLYGPGSKPLSSPKADSQLSHFERVSVSASFDTSRTADGTSAEGTAFRGDFEQLAEVTGRVEIINNRDVLSRASFQKIRELANTESAEDFVDSGGQFLEMIQEMPGYVTSVETAGQAFLDAGPDQARVKAAYQQLIQDLGDELSKVPGGTEPLERFVRHWSRFKKNRDEVYKKIERSKTLAFEYAFRRPPATTVEAMSGSSMSGEIRAAASEPSTPAASASITTRAPDISTAKLIFSNGVFDGEFTANASVSFFHESRPEMRGRWRDLQAAVQYDYPLGNLPNHMKGTVTFAGRYVHLHQKPLGMDLKINDQTVNQPGNIGLFQAKYTIPVGDSGVKIPISFTVSNRTELIKEREVRGNIGLTFDLDKLFAKSKTASATP